MSPLEFIKICQRAPRMVSGYVQHLLRLYTPARVGQWLLIDLEGELEGVYPSYAAAAAVANECWAPWNAKETLLWPFEINSDQVIAWCRLLIDHGWTPEMLTPLSILSIAEFDEAIELARLGVAV